MPDEYGYPTDEELDKISNWKISNQNDWVEWMQYIQGLWMYEDYNWQDDEGVWHLSTGGWSGNEDVIFAMKKNHVAWMISWESSRRGGHHTFELNGLRFKEDNTEE